MAVIIRMDFVGYFLIVADFINWSKDHDIPVGPGRGSGAGSIVAYALRITDIEPLKYGLLFERFLNPERVSMPDFDVDFSDEGREDVIRYVTEKYGKDRVGQIITFGTLKAKAVIKDVARVLDIGFNESNILTKLVPDKPPVDEKGKPLPLYKLIHELPELEAYYNRGGIYRELFDTAAKLENLNRHASTHAAGVVIGKTKLTDYVPLYKDPKTGAISTQFTMDLLEDCGLVKMDFLGLKTLTIIKNTLNLVNKKRAALKEQPLKEEDIPEDERLPLVMHGQGFKDMSPSIEALEAELLNARVVHGMHPVLTMCASNALVVFNPTKARKFEKAKSTGRIDGLVALAMAIGIASRMEEPEDEGNIYEKYEMIRG